MTRYSQAHKLLADRVLIPTRISMRRHLSRHLLRSAFNSVHTPSSAAFNWAVPLLQQPVAVSIPFRSSSSSSSSSRSSTSIGDDDLLASDGDDHPADIDGGGGGVGSGAVERDEDKWSWGWSPPKNQQLVGGDERVRGAPRWPVPGSDDAATAETPRSALPPPVRNVKFTLAEVTTALEDMGGGDVFSVAATAALASPPTTEESRPSPASAPASVSYRFGEGVTHMVVASGETAGHLRRMASVLVAGLKQRRLAKVAPGASGAEGFDCDDWMVVDMGNLLVHLVDGQTRQALRLEQHWMDPERLVDQLSASGAVARGRGQKGGKGGRRSKGDEEAAEARIDALVAANPVPEDYNV